MIKNYWNKGTRQKRNVITCAIILVLLLFFLRDDYQPVLLFLRKFIFLLLLGGLFLWFMLSRFRNALSAGKRVLILLGIVLVFGVLWFFGWKLELYQYMQTYNVYKNLNIEELDELPLTQNERIQPFNNIVTTPSIKDYVKITNIRYHSILISRCIRFLLYFILNLM